MKRICICAIIITLIFCGCISANHANITSKEKYGQWNDEVKNLLNSDFKGSLPNKSLVDKYCMEYHYTYDHAPAGDPAFNIYADLHIDDINDFSDEIIRFSNYDFVNKNGIIYYLINFNSEDLNELLNNEIYDGMYFVFEVAAVDEQKQEIRYLSSYVWDYNKSKLINQDLLLGIIDEGLIK